MNKKKVLWVGLVVIAVILVILGLLLGKKNDILSKNKITIIDASYACAKVKEDFYEDDNYIYSFSCTKSNSVYVKFSNGNKMLVKTALEEKKVTINELIKAGLEVNKRKK
jgi:hypothetical protein